MIDLQTIRYRTLFLWERQMNHEQQWTEINYRIPGKMQWIVKEDIKFHLNGQLNF